MTGAGFPVVIDHLKQIALLHKKDQKKVYVIGSTNTGKSTFLNKLV